MTRTRTIGEIHYRSMPSEVEIKGNTVRGYAARYGVRSHLLFDSFYEIFDESRCFRKSLNAGDNIVGALNHKREEMLLGKRSSGTVRAEDRPDGVYYEIDLPKHGPGPYARELLERGDITESSIAYCLTSRDGIRSERLDDGYYLDRIMEAKVVDVSPVTFGGFPETSAELNERRLFERGEGLGDRPRPEADDTGRLFGALIKQRHGVLRRPRR